MTTPAVTIYCKRPGFRRCGIAHPAEATYPEGYFAFDELETLEGETALFIKVLDADPAQPSAEQIRDAVLQLDKDKDFTQAGEPKLDALEKALGTKVSRAEVTAALEAGA